MDERGSSSSSPVLPSKKKSRLSLKNRFKSTSKEKLTEMAKTKVPENTLVSTRWAMKNFTDWFDCYNRENPDDLCPQEALLPSCDPVTLNKWLCVFICETRTKSGDPYPPRTLVSLLSGILRHMRFQNSMYPDFLNKRAPEFSEFTSTLDNLFKDLRAEGVGAKSTPTETITIQEENALWSSGVLNINTPMGLLRAVFFYNGKCFCLRGGQEHRNLQLSQLKKVSSPERYIYYENASKNRKGGLLEVDVQHKSVASYGDSKAGIRCHVFLLDLYLSKLPDEAIAKDFFYCRPLPSVADDDKVWYAASPVGRNTLSKMVQTMCLEANIHGNKTNHSLRVAGTTALFDAGVPEKIIQGRTGHKSTDGLRAYERVSDEQQEKVSKILSGSLEKFGEEQKALNQCGQTPDSTPIAQYNNCTLNMYSTPGSFYPYHQIPQVPPPAMMPLEHYSAWPALNASAAMYSIPPCPTEVNDFEPNYQINQ